MNDQEKETSTREELNKLDVEYEILDIDPDFSDTRLFCEKYSIDPENTVNALLITSKSQIREFEEYLFEHEIISNDKLKEKAARSCEKFILKHSQIQQGFFTYHLSIPRWVKYNIYFS